MKLIRLAPLALAGTLAACTSGMQASVDYSYQQFEKQIHYDNPALMKDVGIRDIKVDRDGNLPRVQATFFNRSHFTKEFEYKITWVDERGFVVDPGSRPWNPVKLSGKEDAPVQATAPNPAAQTFRIAIRKP